MNSFPHLALLALSFAAVAWSGAGVGALLVAGRELYEGGPQPVDVPRWTFAAAGAVVGCSIAAHPPDAVRICVLLVAVLALAGCAAADFACGALPDVLTLPPLCLTIALGALARDPLPAFGASIAALPFAVTALLSRGRGMGWGDVKLAALGGALLGAGGATVAFGLAAVTAYLVSRTRRACPIAFGPYLAASIAAVLPLTRTI